MAAGPVVGLCAHVDAGKTTLSESILFLSGTLRRQGRVDHGDAFLDTNPGESRSSPRRPASPGTARI